MVNLSHIARIPMYRKRLEQWSSPTLRSLDMNCTACPKFALVCVFVRDWKAYQLFGSFDVKLLESQQVERYIVKF
jgi:hypothetical protein